MVKRHKKERLSAQDLRTLGQNPNLVTRKIPRARYRNSVTPINRKPG